MDECSRNMSIFPSGVLGMLPLLASFPKRLVGVEDLGIPDDSGDDYFDMYITGSDEGRAYDSEWGSVRLPDAVTRISPTAFHTEEEQVLSRKPYKKVVSYVR